MVDAFEIVARHHNDAKVAGSADPRASPFFDRPYRVLGPGRFVDACVEQIADPWLRGLPLFGGIDQIVDSTDVLSYAERTRRFRTAFEQ